MFKQNSIIKFRNKPLFQRALAQAPYGFNAQMKDLACFFYVVDGNYQVIEKHGECRIGSKEALIKKCGNYVARYLKTEEHDTCDAVAIYLYPDLLQEVYKNQLPSFLIEERQVTPPKKMIANELIEKYMNNLFVYFDNPELIDEELALLKLKELILILMKSEQHSNVRRFLSDLFSPRQLEFTSIVENNIFSNISIEELAFICNKSLSSFKRAFKRIYNETPGRYIRRKRLEHAAQLLLTSKESITNIAFDSGFQDISTFSYAFNQHYKISPSKYREMKVETT